MSGAPELNLVEKIVVPATVQVKRYCAATGRKANETNGIPVQTSIARALAPFSTNPRR